MKKLMFIIACLIISASAIGQKQYHYVKTVYALPYYDIDRGLFRDSLLKVNIDYQRNLKKNTPWQITNAKIYCYSTMLMDPYPYWYTVYNSTRMAEVIKALTYLKEQFLVYAARAEREGNIKGQYYIKMPYPLLFEGNCYYGGKHWITDKLLEMDAYFEVSSTGDHFLVICKDKTMRHRNPREEYDFDYSLPHGIMYFNSAKQIEKLITILSNKFE